PAIQIMKAISWKKSRNYVPGSTIPIYPAMKKIKNQTKPVRSWKDYVHSSRDIRIFWPVTTICSRHVPSMKWKKSSPTQEETIMQESINITPGHSHSRLSCLQEYSDSRKGRCCKSLNTKNKMSICVPY